jgi:hypothetical protein
MGGGLLVMLSLKLARRPDVLARGIARIRVRRCDANYVAAERKVDEPGANQSPSNQFPDARRLARQHAPRCLRALADETSGVGSDAATRRRACARCRVASGARALLAADRSIRR